MNELVTPNGADYRFPDHQGAVVYEGLVALSQADRECTFWGRIYMSDRDLDGGWTFAEPSVITGLSFELVITSERPDLPIEERPDTRPAPPFAASPVQEPWTARTLTDHRGGFSGVVEARWRGDISWSFTQALPCTWTTSLWIFRRG